MVTEPSRAQDSVGHVVGVLFGVRKFVQQNTVMTSPININSPMTFETMVMMGRRLEVYAQNNQACNHLAVHRWAVQWPAGGLWRGTLTQVLAEGLARGVALYQLCKPGAPVISGRCDFDRHELGGRLLGPPRPRLTYGAGNWRGG